MTERRFKTYKPGRGGWSEWVQPIMNGYMMKCCDCGLVHEMQFRALKQVSETNARGEWKAEPVKDGRVEFRVRRARK
jgi:hypothetical protein